MNTEIYIQADLYVEGQVAHVCSKIPIADTSSRYNV